MTWLPKFVAYACALPLAVQAQSAPEWRTDFSRHTVPLSEIVSGGPPKDGIPAIDRPRFETVGTADRWLNTREPVIVVEHGDSALAAIDGGRDRLPIYCSSTVSPNPPMRRFAALDHQSQGKDRGRDDRRIARR